MENNSYIWSNAFYWIYNGLCSVEIRRLVPKVITDIHNAIQRCHTFEWYKVSEYLLRSIFAIYYLLYRLFSDFCDRFANRVGYNDGYKDAWQSKRNLLF